jgi:hypothetical protein
MNPAPEPIIATQPAEPSMRETASTMSSMVIGSSSSPPATRGTNERKMRASAMASMTELGKRRATSASSTVARINGSSALAATSGSAVAVIPLRERYWLKPWRFNFHTAAPIGDNGGRCAYL